MTLVKILQTVFKKFIYSPHIHNYVVIKKDTNRVTVMDLTSSHEVYILQCADCGKLIIKKVDNK